MKIDNFIKDLMFNNIGLKLIALILAILTWFYVVGELNKVSLIEENAPLSAYYPYKLQSKYLTILPRFDGAAPSGYKIDDKKVEIEPRECFVLGPAGIIERLDYIQTKAINISEYTKSFKTKVGLRPIGGIKLPGEDFVTVSVPVVKKDK